MIKKETNSTAGKFLDGKAGFTLIEILVVAGVLVLLSGIVLAFVGPARSEAKKRGVNAAFRQFRTQMAVNSGGIPEFATACNGQAIKNIVDGLKSLTNSSPTCYEPETPTDLRTDTNNECGCYGTSEWVFWINLGEYDNNGAVEHFTCISSTELDESKLTTALEPEQSTCQ